MNAKQYLDALSKLDLTQVGASEVLQVGPRTSRRWALDEAPIPPAVAVVIRLLVDGRLSPDEIPKLAK